AFISNGYLQVYTRCGGGNRESCQHVFDEIAKHPLYSHNADDDYDTTYCTFFFNIPDEYKEICKDILDMPSTSERWKQALEAMSDSINK
ncbi:MAG TPA: hypothetical protein VN698_03475, partial [Bacteroidia bacterium]|nr:hypothetical protein [Bacteroidia bacterium]